MLKVDNLYWIATENYGVLKAIYKEAGEKKIGFFQCMLIDGYLILNNGIKGYRKRDIKDDNPPKTPKLEATKDEWEAMGWKR